VTAAAEDRLCPGPLPDQERGEVVMIERLVLRHGLVHVVAEPDNDLGVHAGPAQLLDPAEHIDGILAAVGGLSAAAGPCRGQGS
jgi:hypothetical protein